MQSHLTKIFLLFWLFCAGRAAAQPRVGVILGMGISTPVFHTGQVASETLTISDKTGWVLGVFTQIPMHSHWTFQPGLRYTAKGHRERHMSNIGYYSYDFTESSNLPYFELPLNFMHSQKPNGDGFRFGAGPVVSFAIHNGFRYPVKRTDFGANAFVGYQSAIGFSINLTYTYGFGNTALNPSSEELKNRFAALTIGYLF